MSKIEIVKLQKSYTDRKKNTTVALYDCSLTVNDGEFLVLLGESGCGKTSLLRVIAGVESYDFGSVLFDGIDGAELDQRDKDISYVSQNYALFPHKTVYENIAMPLFTNKYPRNEIRKRVSELAEQFGLQMLLTRLPADLSGGQQQRVAIARALAKRPSICLFDEPLSALDPMYHEGILSLLAKLHAQTDTTFIYATHNLREAVRIADRIAVMHDRKVEQIGTPHELLRNPQTEFVREFLSQIE